MLKKRTLQYLALLLLAVVVTASVFLFTPKPFVQRSSDYALTSQLAANQPSYYPIQQTLDPRQYRPIDNWVGRLILPKPEEFQHYFFEVVRDPFTEELQWDISYYQVYAQNPQGILSGSQSWANYMGNLQRGWLNSRPTSNVMLKLDVLRDYNFGGISLSPLMELQRQLEIMMARYRTGDGTGDSSVTPASSCVQDSNQALYITIEILKEQIQRDTAISDWLNNHPDDPQAQRFQKLVQLGDRLEQVLIPRGVVRSDWKHNAETLAGVKVRHHYPFSEQNTLANALLSWQSMLPRVAHDILSTIFLEQGTTLWFLRTNQVSWRIFTGYFAHRSD